MPCSLVYQVFLVCQEVYSKLFKLKYSTCYAFALHNCGGWNRTNVDEIMTLIRLPTASPLISAPRLELGLLPYEGSVLANYTKPKKTRTLGIEPSTTHFGDGC